MGYFRLKRAYIFPSISVAPSSFQFQNIHTHTYFFFFFFFLFSCFFFSYPLLCICYFVTIFLALTRWPDSFVRSFAHVNFAKGKKCDVFLYLFKTSSCSQFDCEGEQRQQHTKKEVDTEGENECKNEKKKNGRTNSTKRKTNHWANPTLMCVLFGGVYMRPTRRVKTLSTGWRRRKLLFHIFTHSKSPFLFVCELQAGERV